MSIARHSSMPLPPPAVDSAVFNCNRWGTVISVLPSPMGALRTGSSVSAPTCDRWGNIVAAPAFSSTRA